MELVKTIGDYKYQAFPGFTVIKYDRDQLLNLIAAVFMLFVGCILYKPAFLYILLFIYFSIKKEIIIDNNLKVIKIKRKLIFSFLRKLNFSDVTAKEYVADGEVYEANSKYSIILETSSGTKILQVSTNSLSDFEDFKSIISVDFNIT